MCSQKALARHGRAPLGNVNYNLQWGRQKRQANKLINVSGDTDRYTAGGR